jgi:hypothetical protein
MAESLKADAVLWAADFRRAFKISERTFRNWRLAKIVPRADGNVLGRDFWLPETYEKMRAEILSGKHSRARRPPHLMPGIPPAA